MSPGGWEESFSGMGGQFITNPANCLLILSIICKTSFQALVDLFSMARLEWRHWDMFTDPPVGTVAVHEKVYLIFESK